ncbi:MAG: glycosyltransferase family 9 protein [Candidatus Zambryskibacteria bacterium]|nr:glycosyltransferase family 9 protein [Candidatus Zambryskibacteria bacterium]
MIWLRKSEKNNILVIPQFKRIGDIVCSTPVFRAIKEKYPESRITVIVSSMAAGVLKNNPRVDEIIIVEDYWHKFPELVRKIRRGNFKWGVSLSGTALSSTLFFLSLIPNRLKITRPNKSLAEALSDWMTNFKEEYKELTYLPLFYLKMLRHLGIDNENYTKEIYAGYEAEAKMKKFLATNGVMEKDKLIGISLTAGNNVKEWGDDKFESLAREISKKYPIKIAFIGSFYEKERVGNFVRKLGSGSKYIDAAGLSLEELVVLMKNFSVFISVDTGPTHIAHALGVPLIDILGPVNDIELTPRDGNIKIIKPNPEIPSTIFAFQAFGPAYLARKALENISVSQVLLAFDELYKVV